MAAIYRYAMDRIGVGEGKLGSDRWFVPGIMNCGLPVYYREMGGYRGAVLWLFSVFFFPFFFFYDGIAGGGGGISSSKRFSEIDHFVLLDSIERIRMTTLFVYLYFCLLFYYFFSISIYRIIWFDFRFSLLCIFNGFDENQTDICINLYLIFGGTEYRWLPCLKTRGLAEGTRGHIRAFSGFRPRGMVFFRRQS